MSELPEELARRPARTPGHEPTARLTLDAYRRLKAELAELETEGRAHIAERLKHAREFGDIRENAEFDAAKNAQGLMESRIRKLREMLRDPDIVETPTDADVAAPGMLITVRPLDEDEPEDETYLLAHAADERAEGVRTVTVSSPFGMALEGARHDDEVEYRAPGGTFRYRVVGIEPFPG
jgi:transcription elongation factor GreA